jgi:hypothetical protein
VRPIFPCVAAARSKPVMFQHMQQMMDGGMMWGMGFGGLIALILLILVIAALVKYVFFR